VLRTRAPGKVNLCLFVGAPRADGLHPLVSVFQPVSLADELTLAPGEAAPEAPARRMAAAGGEAVAAVRDAAAGLPPDVIVCPGVDGDNLAGRALAEFRAATGWSAGPRTLTIVKHVPVAAGMGGGSADAAAALRLAAAESGRPIPAELPMRLGADVPVLLHPARALVTGAGEHVEPLPPGPETTLVIVPLDAALSTAAVYREFDAGDRPRERDELADWAERLRAGEPPPAVNDLQAAARRLCPSIDRALEALRDAGVARPLVTGSGPTVFGLSDDPEAPARLRSAGYPRARAATPAGPEEAEVR
jgi:4-diphosphocytidyl-2-C-methyl-D-erythritol kinase